MMISNKRGWMRILEATIAVMIVTSVLIVVYSNQNINTIDKGEYFYSLQRQILSDIAIRSDLRISVLGSSDASDATQVEEDNYEIINEFVFARVPDNIGYYVAVCKLGDELDNCKMSGEAVAATIEKDVFVEDIIVSADLGDGTNEVYNPTKLRLYMWDK